MAKTNDNDGMGCLVVIVVVVVVASIVSVLTLPRDGGVEDRAYANYEHVEVIRDLLIELGNHDIKYQYQPWNSDIEAKFQAVVFQIQSMPQFGTEAGWEYEPDGLWTREYSAFLDTILPEQINQVDRILGIHGPETDFVIEFKGAADALVEGEVIWMPSQFDAASLQFWNVMLSGFGD